MTSHEAVLEKYGLSPKHLEAAAKAEAKQFRKTVAGAVALFVSLTLAGGIGLGFGIDWLLAKSPAALKASAACDAAVRTLLETRDPLELERADMLVRHLNCEVARRMPTSR